MVGSRRFFIYTDESGVEWSIERDEQITEAINPTEDTVPANAGSDTLPRLIEPRTARYNTADGNRSVTGTLLNNTAAAFLALPFTININRAGTSVTYYLTSYQGERRRYVPGIDTGETGGDSEGAIVVNP